MHMAASRYCWVKARLLLISLHTSAPQYIYSSFISSLLCIPIVLNMFEKQGCSPKTFTQRLYVWGKINLYDSDSMTDRLATLVYLNLRLRDSIYTFLPAGLRDFSPSSSDPFPHNKNPIPHCIRCPLSLCILAMLLMCSSIARTAANCCGDKSS